MKRNRSLKFVVAALAVALLVLPAAAQVNDHKKIKYPKLPTFEIEKPETFKLQNGMTVFLMEDHELPLIRVSMRIRTGSNWEPAEKTGLAGIFGQVMREGGTTSMTGDEIDDYLAARAAFVETGVGGDSGSASMNCLKEDFDEVFAVLDDILRNPAFAEDKVDLAKVQNSTGIARRNDSVSQISGREFRRLIYGYDAPMSRMVEYSTIENISRNDLVAWHQKYYHPNNMYIGVVGDFDPAEMRGKIEGRFGKWAAGPAFNESDVAYDTSNTPGVHFIEKEDVTQSYVSMGHLGILRSNPDYFAVQVMNEVLAGGFAGRLFSNVRSKKGLAYSVGGGIGSSFNYPGIFQVRLSTKSETMAESVEALKEEVRGIIDTPATAEELDRARESISNSFVFNYDSKGEILAQQMSYAYYGLPADYLDQYLGKIMAVTKEDVARVAKKYIHPDKMRMLVVGKSEDFDRPVSTFGSVKTVSIDIPGPADKRAEVVKTAASSQQGAAVLARAAKTLSNGSGKVESVASEATLILQMGGQSISMGLSSSFVLPNKTKQVYNTPMGNQTMVINGENGFLERGGQTQPMPADQIEDGLESLGRELLVLASHADNPGVEAVAIGEETIEGTSCEVVAVSYMGSDSRLCVAEDGKVLRQSYQGKFQGAPGLMEITFSEYADVEGRLYPHKRVVVFEGREVATLTIDSIEINPTEIDMSQFEVPAE